MKAPNISRTILTLLAVAMPAVVPMNAHTAALEDYAIIKSDSKMLTTAVHAYEAAFQTVNVQLMRTGYTPFALLGELQKKWPCP